MVVERKIILKKIFSKVVGRKRSKPLFFEVVQVSSHETHNEDDYGQLDEDDLRHDIEVTRVDTMHADLTLPMDVRDGEEITIEHNGAKTIKVPRGQQGQCVRIKMIREDNLL